MRRYIFLLVLIPLSGCAETMVGRRSTILSGTVDNLYYSQVVNNLAMLHENPSALPYFGLPNQGTTSVTRQAQGSYTPTWNFITDVTSPFFGGWRLTSQQAGLQGSTQAAETWQVAPTSNPDYINLLRCAYRKAMGICDPECEAILAEYFGFHKSAFNYQGALQPGWYGVGRRRDVPRGACYVGHCGHTYVWVMPQDMEGLSRFTLAVLDIVTLSPTPPAVFPPTASLESLPPEHRERMRAMILQNNERLIRQHEQGFILQPRNVPTIPYPAPPRP